MTAEARQHAVELVRRIVAADGTDEEIHALLNELHHLVPDPRVADLIFWPQHHPLSADLSEQDLTPELIVDLAHRYSPLALGAPD